MYIPSSTGPWHAKGTWETLTWLNRPCLLRSICFLEVQHLRGLRVRVVILKQTVARTSLWGSYQASHIPSAAAGALVHSSIIYSCQHMEANKVSINRWIDKEDVVHIYNGILLRHKKEWNNAICSNTDGLEGIMLLLLLLSRFSRVRLCVTP